MALRTSAFPVEIKAATRYFGHDWSRPFVDVHEIRGPNHPSHRIVPCRSPLCPQDLRTTPPGFVNSPPRIPDQSPPPKVETERIEANDEILPPIKISLGKLCISVSVRV